MVAQANDPITPSKASHASQVNLDPPPAPRHVNRGRLDMDTGRALASPEVSPHGVSAAYPATLDSADMYQTAQDITCSSQQSTSNITEPLSPPVWTGPAVVSGQVANPDDPFVSAALTGSTPAFVPANGQTSSGSGGSASPPGGLTEGGSSNDHSTHGSGGNSNGSSANMSRDSSSGSNGQSSDGAMPVIVTTPHAGRKGKQAVRSEMPGSNVTRFIRVENVFAVHFEEDKPLGMIKGLQPFKEDVQKLGIFALKPAGADTGSQTILMFVDTRTGAQILFDHFKRTHATSFISYEEFTSAKVKIPDTIDRLSAEVTFTVSLKGKSRSRRFSTDAITEMAKTAAAKFGWILRFELADDSAYAKDGYMRFNIEYNSVADANDAVHTTNPASGVTLPYGTHEHLQIHARGYWAVNADSPAGLASDTTPSSRRKSSVQETLEYSPTGRTATRKAANGKTATVAGYVAPSKMAGPSDQTQTILPNGGQFARNIYQTFDPVADMPMLGPDGRPHAAIAKPQDVVEIRIVQGYDVRTTLMVRNVPPEMTGMGFVDMLNDTVPGEFDFSYNRIDFQKSQSVGYAFVNFTGTDALLRFVRRWRGMLLPHNIYRQHLRPCAVSYANTQGYECLVAKFRNSSILDEAKPCRPMLFWTKASAKDRPELIGQEREWPGVDNASKKNRSVENAKISGLYTPRARINGGRGGRRGGHTRFDRGTTAQQQDENQVGFHNYQHGIGPAPMYNQYAQPRYQPSPMLYNWHTSQFVPQGMSMMTNQMPNQMPPMMPPLMRTHTNGDLGYRHPVMPAQVAPVNSPTHAQTAHQDLFQPLLYPVKGQVPEYYRSV